MRVWCMLSGAMFLGAAACVPTDEALPLGAAEFTITARFAERSLTTVDGWALHIDRYVLGFRTMTVQNLQDSDQCSYRGRGADANIIVDGTVGSIIQSFNGVKPGPCPDVGLRLTVPDDYTRVGEGTTLADLLDLATTQTHAFVMATATQDAFTKHVLLRFDPVTTTMAFASCRASIRGVKIEPDGRDAVFVAFDASAFFRNALSAYSDLAFAPFAAADADNDGQITMTELDQFQSFFGGGGLTYTLPSGESPTSLGQWVRAQFQASLHYDTDGVCDGLDAGTILDQ